MLLINYHNLKITLNFICELTSFLPGVLVSHIRTCFSRIAQMQVKMWNLRKPKFLIIQKLKTSVGILGKHIFQQPVYTTGELICSLNASQFSSIQIPLVTHEWEKALFCQWFSLVFHDPSPNELVHLFLTIDCFSYEVNTFLSLK